MGEYGMMNDSMTTTMSIIDTGFNLFALLSFIGMGYGLYVLAKKMNIKNAWMGWVPILQFYIMSQVAGLSFKKYIVYPILFIVAIALFGGISVAVLASTDNMGAMMGLGIVTGILYLVAYINYLLKYIKILSATSKRTGRGGWTTAGLFFIPFIMYPIVATKFKGLNEEQNINKEDKEKEEEIKVEL